MSDVSKLILGIDLGNATSCVAAYNAANESSEIIDFSGGYAKASVPTMLKLTPKTLEWTFGEDAAINIGDSDEVSISGLVSMLRNSSGVSVQDVYYPAEKLISMFIKNLLEKVLYLNPNCEILKIVISFDDYIGKRALIKLSEAMSNVGINKEIFLYRSDSDCILTKTLYEKSLACGKVIILDYGSRELIGKIFDVSTVGENYNANVDSLNWSEEIGTSAIENDILNLITTYYCEETEQVKESLSFETRSQLKQFALQHKDLFFKKGILTKPSQLYYNFAYPPFRKTITSEVSEQMISKYKQNLSKFLNELVDDNDISLVICVGSGFEMFWAKDFVNERFKDINVICSKSPNYAQAEGAAILCALQLGICEAKPVEINDSFKAVRDIGIFAISDNEMKFLSLIEEGAHTLTETKRQVVILADSTENDAYIDIYAKSIDYSPKVIERFLVPGLPIRPKGTMKLGVSLKFINRSELMITLEDDGFGEIFPKTDFIYSTIMKY